MNFLERKYGLGEAALGRATRRIVELLNALDAQLAAQHARGRRYLVGEAVSALDIYWAAGCGFLDPMPEDRCPMCTDFRNPNLYGTPNADTERALTPVLRAHRDVIYERHL